MTPEKKPPSKKLALLGLILFKIKKRGGGRTERVHRKCRVFLQDILNCYCDPFHKIILRLNKISRIPISFDSHTKFQFQMFIPEQKYQIFQLFTTRIIM